MRSVKLSLLALSFLILFLTAGIAQAEDISGTITSTKTIFEDSQLVGDVTCAVANGPCIRFGASHIKLRLNGFTMTGPADPPSNCLPAPSGGAILGQDGIAASGVAVPGLSHVRILGPGIVQKFRRHGLFMAATTRVTVEHVTSNHNCFSGILMSGTTNSRIEANVSVRNAIASGPSGSPCGGNCIVNSHNNRIRRNVFGGNGAAVDAFPEPPLSGNDFGVGLVFGSSGNVIEENAITGNINGVLLHGAGFGIPSTSNNIVRKNIIAGNPPVQVSATFGPTIGFDIRDESPAGANTFSNNLCITYDGAGPAPCPNIPRFAGHRNIPARSEGDDGGDD